MMGYYVRRGFYEGDKLIIQKELFPVDEQEFERQCKYLEDYLIALETINTSSYDNSDDERVEDNARYTSSFKYRELNPKNNSEYLLMIDNKIAGVVFVVTQGQYDSYLRAFTFDGKIAQSMRLGYYASHSSYFEYVDRVRLVKKGSKGIPSEAREANFKQSEMYPSL